MRSLTALTLLLCLAELSGISKAMMVEERTPELEKLQGLAEKLYKELVEQKVDFPDSQIRAKLEVFSQLKKLQPNKLDVRRPFPSYFLPAKEYPVSMDRLLSYGDGSERYCSQLSQRERIVISNERLVSPALYRYLKKTTEDLSTYCLEQVLKNVEKFQENQPEEWGLVSEFNRLVSKHGVLEPATEPNEARLDKAMYELLTDKLSAGEYNYGQLLKTGLDDARSLVEKTKVGCRSYMSAFQGGLSYVINSKKNELREWLRLKELCDQVVNRNFAESLERIEKELKPQ